MLGNVWAAKEAKNLTLGSSDGESGGRGIKVGQRGGGVEGELAIHM